MPKSKRNKIVNLTQTKTKGKQGKEDLINEVASSLLKYKSVYVLQFENSRNAHSKTLRQHFRTSRFFFGKNKVMMKALEASDKPNLHKIIPHFVGQRGLFFTNEPATAALEYMKKFVVPDFARSGFTATRDVVIKAGTLPDHEASLELRFRTLGVPTRLNNGVIEVLGDYVVCRKGNPLTPEQAAILKLLGEKMSDFRVQVICRWENGEFENISGDLGLDQEEEEGEEGDEEQDISED